MPKGRRPYLGGLLLGITVARRSCVVEAPALLRLVSPGNTTQRFPPLLDRRCGLFESGTEGSNPPSSSSQSVSAVNAEAVSEKSRTLAAVCGWLGT
jgi:hypothetical protein